MFRVVILASFEDWCEWWVDPGASMIGWCRIFILRWIVLFWINYSSFTPSYNLWSSFSIKLWLWIFSGILPRNRKTMILILKSDLLYCFYYSCFLIGCGLCLLSLRLPDFLISIWYLGYCKLIYNVNCFDHSRGLVVIFAWCSIINF